MSEPESPNPIPQDSPATDPIAVQRRLDRHIPLVSLVLTLIGVWKGGSLLALSILLGCGLSYLNYRWMSASLRHILATTKDKPSARQMSKFLSRWVVIGVVMVVASKLFYFSMLGILIGLFAFPIAVMLEGAYQAMWVAINGLD